MAVPPRTGCRAELGPGQAGDDSRVEVRTLVSPVKRTTPKYLVTCWILMTSRLSPLRRSCWHTAADGPDLALQIGADRPPRVAGDDVPQGSAAEADLVCAEAVGLALPGDQVPLGDVDFFVLGVTQQLQTSMRSLSAGGMVSRMLGPWR